MPLPSRPIASAGALPPGYVQVLYWRVTATPARIITAQLLGLAAFVVFGLLFAALAIGLGRLPPNLPFGLAEAGWVLAGSVVTIVLHELTHGLAMRGFGARPTYGVLWQALAFYATSPDYAFPRWAFVVIALGPLAGLSLMVIAAMWLWQGSAWVALLAVCGVINASGAVGDLWMTAIVLRYPASAYVMDERDGIRVFLPKA